MKFTDCNEEIGKNLLQNPLDLCIIPKTGELVIADDANGILIFKRGSTGTYEFDKQVKELCDAGSISYCSSSNNVYISLARAPDSKKCLAEIDCETWKITREVELPTTPKMRAGFICWVAVSDRYAFVMSGDNNVAATWRIDRKEFKTFETVLETDGDLEHPYVVDDETILVARWTLVEDWSIKEVTIPHKGQSSMRTLVGSMPGLTQPWSFAICEDQLIAYDYSTGALVLFLKQGGQYVLQDSPAKVPFGQWVSMEVGNEGKLYVTCSDERVVREFT